MQIGLVGAGNIGRHFAARLHAAGYDLTVFDVDAAAVERARRAGIGIASNVVELADRCDVVLLSLPKPDVVAQVAIGEGGVIEGKAVRVLVDLSTTGPSATERIAGVVEAKGIDFVGAPVSGGTVAAEHGTLTVMAAGKEDVVKALEPLFRTIAKNIFYLGRSPALGQTMKIINNTLYAVSLVASCEALVYGVKAGLDARTMLDVVNVSSGRSFATQERIPQCVLDRSFPVRFTTELLHKDISMFLAEAAKLGARMEVSPAARDFLAFAISEGDGEKDNAYTIRHFEASAGVQFGVAPATRG
jgi:3-hydroxyisobutyrate dehydrogenase